MMNHSSDEFDEDDEEMYNESGFDDIQPEFKNLVLATKRQLYDCIIKGPPIDSNAAQDNRLLIEYIAKLNVLYQMCKLLNSGTLSATKLQSKLSTFPMESRENIAELTNWLNDFTNKNEYVDTIPYNDYLEVHLIRHPFIQK